MIKKIDSYYYKPSFMEKIDTKNKPSYAVQVNSPSKIAFGHLNAIQKENVAQSYVPFLFKNKNIDHQNNINSPSPGQYQLKSAFEESNQRDVLEEQYKLVMENSKKIKESVVFKSTAKRFDYKNVISETPISYSYRLSGDKSITKNFSLKKERKNNCRSFSNLKKNELYPSIPDKSIKFGYKLGTEGKLDKINKTQDQLLKERQGMKNYVKNLKAQKQYQKKQTYQSIHSGQKKQEVLDKITQAVGVKTSISQPNLTKREKSKMLKQENSKICRKQANIDKVKQKQFKICKILEQKQELNQKLGPGTYDVRINSLVEYKKPQKFQFFNSTSQRFTESMRFHKIEPVKNILKKIQIENKIFESKKMKSSNVWKRLKIKKPERSSDKSFSSSKQYVLPGPGDYNPNQKLTKMDVGKNKIFDKSVRFENKEKSDIIQNNEKMTILTTSKEHTPLKGQRANQRSNYGQIMKLLKSKKTQVQLQYRRYITKGHSEYSICSWENRPISRNDTFPALQKQILKIENQK